MSRGGRIRTQMYLLLFAVAIPLIVLLAFAIFDDMKHDERQASATAMVLAQNVADDVQAVVGDTHDLLQQLARRPLVRALDAARCDPMLNELLGLNRRLLSLFTLGPDGRIVCGSEAPVIGRVRASAAAREEERRLAATVHGLPMVVRGADGLRTVQSEQLRDAAGSPDGAVAVVMDGARYEPAAHFLRFPPGTMYEILDADGMVVHRVPQPERWTGTGGRGTEIVDAVLRQPAGQAQAVGIDGVERVYGFTAIGDTGWHAVAGIPIEVVFGPARALAVQNSLLALFIVGGVAVAAWFLARRVTAPIHRMAQAAQAVAAGRLDMRVAVSGPQEIVDVAEQFNVMLETRRRSEELLRETGERLQALSRRLLEVQEIERRHIARELHDEVGQALTAIRIHLEAMRRLAAMGGAAAQLGECIRIAEGTLRQVRDLCLDLRPPQLDDLGLEAALRWQLDRQTRAAGITAHFSADGLDLQPSPEVATACFRVAQEAITNVVRHAGARQIWVELSRVEDELRLLVRDDGAGFDVAAQREGARHGGSMGLLSMEERVDLAGGWMDISSESGRGTEICAVFPMDGAKPSQVHGPEDRPR